MLFLTCVYECDLSVPANNIGFGFFSAFYYIIRPGKKSKMYRDRNTKIICNLYICVVQITKEFGYAYEHNFGDVLEVKL